MLKKLVFLLLEFFVVGWDGGVWLEFCVNVMEDVVKKVRVVREVSSFID